MLIRAARHVHAAPASEGSLVALVALGARHSRPPSATLDPHRVHAARSRLSARRPSAAVGGSLRRGTVAMALSGNQWLRPPADPINARLLSLRTHEISAQNVSLGRCGQPGPALPVPLHGSTVLAGAGRNHASHSPREVVGLTEGRILGKGFLPLQVTLSTPD